MPLVLTHVTHTSAVAHHHHHHPTLQVRLSKIFQWYSPDFGANKAERLCFLLPHLPRQQAADIHSLLADDPHAARVRVMHKPYDWGVNDADTGAV